MSEMDSSDYTTSSEMDSAGYTTMSDFLFGGDSLENATSSLLDDFSGIPKLYLYIAGGVILLIAVLWILYGIYKNIRPTYIPNNVYPKYPILRLDLSTLEGQKRCYDEFCLHNLKRYQFERYVSFRTKWFNGTANKRWFLMHMDLTVYMALKEAMIRELGEEMNVNEVLNNTLYTMTNSNEIETPKVDLEINRLQFPNDTNIYKYQKKDFEYVDIIESSRHMVKEFRYKPLNIQMAVKIIRIPQDRYQDQDNDDKVKKLKKEIANFRSLSIHQNIVDFYGLCFNDSDAMICMELMDMSLYDLYLVVHDEEKKFPEEILGYVAVQVLEALGFCKSNNFIHRDVKPKNILLNTRGEVKLCDFGESRILKDSLASTFVGTIAYWPPERFEANKPIQEAIQNQNEEDIVRYDVRSDIWSLGITLAETVYGKLPFTDDKGASISHDNNTNNGPENIVTIQHCILSTKTDELIPRCFGTLYSADLTEFVSMCLEKLDKRPKFDALMKTNFYKNFKENVKEDDMAAFIASYNNVIF